MHRVIYTVMSVLLGVAALAATPELPPQPKEGLLVVVELSAAATAARAAWQQQEKAHLGPPAPYLWIIWRLRKIPEGVVDSPLISGCDKLENNQPAPVIDVPGIGPGLWRLTASVQTDVTNGSRVVLAGWRCMDLKAGITKTTARLALQPATSLAVRLELDRAPDPHDPAAVSVCLFDDHGLVDMQIVAMKEQAFTLVYPFAPEGRLRILVVVLNDLPPIRITERTVAIDLQHNRVIVPLARAPARTPRPAPSASAGVVGRFFLVN